MKICSIIGTRPQFIKLSAFCYELKKYKKIKHTIINTGQHYDHNMSSVFIKELKISQPHYNLKIGGGTHGKNTAKMIEEIEKILLANNFDLIIVFGDTDSTLAGALSAVKLNIKIAHIEAGLRSYDISMPEEVNRIIVDQISSYLFVPTEISKKNLLKEGKLKKRIFVVGDIMLDQYKLIQDKIKNNKTILINNGLVDNEYILATIHRKINTDNIVNLNNILKGFLNSRKLIVIPLHPRTRKMINKNLIKNLTNIKFIKPVSYLDMQTLINKSQFVITDSGGLQKEAYFNKKFSYVIREKTEWDELIKYGHTELIPAISSEITKKIRNYCKKNIQYKKLYGNGDSAKKIIRILLKNFYDH